MEQHNHFQQQSHKMALCGMMTALSTSILSAGGLIPSTTFACPMLAMLCLLPVLCDYGRKYALLVYAAGAILSLMLCVDKEMAFFYLFLGWYPAVRPMLDRLPRLFRIPLKCALFTLALAAMYALMIFLFRMEAIMAEFAEYSGPMFILLLLLANASLLLTDRLLERVSALYLRWRKR